MTRTRDGVVVAARCAVADTPWTRFRGLSGRRGLDAGEGLLITPCGSVHMLGMRFAIDAVFLDGDRRVLKIAAGLRPWRMAGARGGREVLELPAGAAGAAGLAAGDELAVTTREGDPAGPAPEGTRPPNED